MRKSSSPQKHTREKGDAVTGIIIIVLILVAGGLYFYKTTRKEVIQNKASEEQAANNASAGIPLDANVIGSGSNP